MHHATKHRIRTGLLTLSCSLSPALAFAGGADEVSLMARDDGFMQAWATSPTQTHDAATRTPTRAAVAERATKPPPPPIVEHASGNPPTAGGAWVRGYWAWDSRANDFAWVSGFWATSPPNAFWVDGSWKRDDRGWYRAPGFWSVRRGEANAPPPLVASTPGPDAEAGAAPGGIEPIDAVQVAPPPLTQTSMTRRVALTQYPATTDSAVVSVEPLPLPSPALPAAELPAPGSGPTGVVASPQVMEPAPTVVTPAPAPAMTLVPAPTPAPVFVAAPSPVIALADQLGWQAATFEQVFGRTAGVTPGGGAFVADARRIRGAAYGLRQAAASGDAYRTSMAYRDINATWQQMAARVNQISPGRAGPNIQQIWRMGATTAEIGRVVP